MTRPIDTVPMPSRVARLPRNAVGYPIPWFVAHLDDGSRDFRIMGGEQFHDAVRFGLCWVCGQPRGRFAAFVIGPMCAVNRVSAEPPSHRDCAVYAARVCPFLSNPQFRRRESGRPADAVLPAGHMIARNPGVALVWVTRTFTTFSPDHGERGTLFDIGGPAETLWFRQGRAATRAEVLGSIDSGLPLLREQCDADPDPAGAHLALAEQVRRAMPLVPVA